MYIVHMIGFGNLHSMYYPSPPYDLFLERQTHTVKKKKCFGAGEKIFFFPSFFPSFQCLSFMFVSLLFLLNSLPLHFTSSSFHFLFISLPLHFTSSSFRRLGSPHDVTFFYPITSFITLMEEREKYHHQTSSVCINEIK